MVLGSSDPLPLPCLNLGASLESGPDSPHHSGALAAPSVNVEMLSDSPINRVNVEGSIIGAPLSTHQEEGIQRKSFVLDLGFRYSYSVVLFHTPPSICITMLLHFAYTAGTWVYA